MNKRSLFLYFLLVCYISFGQSNFIEKDEKYIDSINKNFDINPDRALQLSFERIKRLDPNSPSENLQKAYSKVGEILSNQGLDKEALKYFNLSHDIFRLRKDNNKKDKMSGAPWNFINIGNIYFKFREFDLAKENYYEAIYNFNLLDSQSVKSYGLATSFDNLGLIELNLKNYEKAKDFYQVAYENRIKNKKAEDIIYSLSALSQIDFLEDNIPAAIDKLDKAKKIFLNYDNIEKEKSRVYRNFGWMNSLLASFYYSKEIYDKAQEYDQLALNYLDEFPIESLVARNNLSSTFIKKGKFSDAIKLLESNREYLKNRNLYKYKKKNFEKLIEVYEIVGNNVLSNKYKDSLISASKIENRSVVSSLISDFEIRTLLLNKEDELKESKSKYNLSFVIFSTLTLILILFVLLLRTNNKLQLEVNSKLENEKIFVKKDLDSKLLELTSTSSYISQRNEGLKLLKGKINKFKMNNFSKIDESKINKFLLDTNRSIDNLVNSNLHYKSFESQFKSIYPDFNSSLLKLHPNLSPGDLRMCAYLKMNQNSNEIALISGASIRTVESQRYRLRKKMNISKDINLQTYLLKI